MNLIRLYIICGLSILFILMSCDSDESADLGADLTGIEYNPQPYVLDIPDYFPDLTGNSDNPLTKDGVQLGRHLFYDPILSVDSTMSCASCHHPDKGFTDGLAFSPGVTGEFGRRSSMSLVNVGFLTDKFFWDGRSTSLEHQAILPVEDPVELNNDWDNIETKLESSERYRSLFRKAFGIRYSGEITRDLATKAIAQFERIIISTNSKFDRERRGEVVYTAKEQDGFDMFFDTSRVLPDAECAHCHNFPLFTSNEFFNNGLDSVDNLSDFKDFGLGEVTKYEWDNGLFKSPGLRNIALTAPYMHDGRFNTLEEVVDHYNDGGHPSPNKDALIINRGLGLSNRQKESLVAFLHTLTDTSYLQNPDILSPF